MPENRTYREIYEPKIREAARRYGIPEAVLVAMIAAESNFDPNAVNAASGASGIAQFMPDTARELGVDPMNPEQAIDGAAAYLRQLIDYYDGDVRKAVAAYNFGAGNLDEALKAAYGKPFNEARKNWQLALPRETQRYLETVFADTGFQTQRVTPQEEGSTLNSGELPEPKIEAYKLYDQDPISGEPVWTGEYDYQMYKVEHDVWKDLTGRQTIDLSQHLDDVIAGISLDIEAGRLSLDKAAAEFDRRFTAFREAGTQYQNLLGYAVPANALYVPGREPGGFYETQTGLKPRQASGQTYNPFEEALNIVNQTPDLTQIETPGVGVGSPNNLFSQALQHEQLSAGGPNAVNTGIPYEERDVDIARRIMGDIPIGVY